VKNIIHALSVEKYSYLFLVHLIAFSGEIARAKNMNKTCM
jgi:hypothetical protein